MTCRTGPKHVECDLVRQVALARAYFLSNAMFCAKGVWIAGSDLPLDCNCEFPEKSLSLSGGLYLSIPRLTPLARITEYFLITLEALQSVLVPNALADGANGAETACRPHGLDKHDTLGFKNIRSGPRYQL